MNDRPSILPGATVLTPMDAGHEPRRRNAKPSEGTAGKGKRDRRKQRDRFGLLNAFVDCGMVGLSRSELATWLVLYRDTRDGTARTSATDIARRIGTDRRTVTDALRGLRQRRLITLVYRGGLNRGVSVYRVHPPPADAPHGKRASR